MASVHEWMEGARLRTLPAAAAPVLIGIGAAIRLGVAQPMRCTLAVVVALALQIGVNFANDYSDGVRGTDEHRSGPQRLTASGAVSARVVLAVALGCFAVAGIAGLILIVWSSQWWLLAAGAAALLAAWLYTGGRHPYGYAGIGVSELFVFMFFGWMATVGTVWVHTPRAPWWLWVAASGVGMLSVALLFTNNIRDIPTDSRTGKTTLAVRLGDRLSRRAYAVCLVLAVLCAPAAMIGSGAASPVVAGVSAALVMASALTARPMLTGASGRDLIAVLRNTGMLTLAYGVLLAIVFICTPL